MPGRSGYLPDISGKFNFFLSMAINSLAQKNYNGSAAGLDNMNALLGKDYIITVNDKLYKQKVDKEFTYQCTNKNCTMITTDTTIDENGKEQESKKTVRNEIPYSKVKVFDETLSLVVEVITGKTQIKVWICPDCKTLNKMSETITFDNKLKRPSFRRVVPSPPISKSGIVTRSTFDRDFEAWFYPFLEQLSHQMGLYRIEYISLNHEDMSDRLTFEDKGDDTKFQ